MDDLPILVEPDHVDGKLAVLHPELVELDLLEHEEKAVVLGQESGGVTLPGIFDPGADGRLAMFHEEHWPMRVGEWHERDRGHATER